MSEAHPEEFNQRLIVGKRGSTSHCAGATSNEDNCSFSSPRLGKGFRLSVCSCAHLLRMEIHSLARHCPQKHFFLFTRHTFGEGDAFAHSKTD